MTSHIIKIAFFLLFCSIASIYSQPLSKSQLPELLSSEQGKLKSVIYQDYSKKGLIEGSRIKYEYEYSDSLNTSIIYALNSDIWVNFKKTEEYYINGNMYKTINYDWYEDEWRPTREVRNEYNEHGKVIDLRVYAPPTRLTHHYTFKLKENGDTLKIIQLSFNDDSTEIYLFNIREYFYNTQGQLERIFEETGFKDTILSNNETIYEYDEFGNMVSSTYNNKGRFGDKSEYTYNESNLLIRFSNFRLNKEDVLEEYLRIEYEHDDNGNIIVERRSSLDKEKAELVLRYVYYYDYNDDNVLIEFLTKQYKYSTLIYYEKTVITYDDYFVSVIDYDWENDRWVEDYMTEKWLNEKGDFELVKTYYPGTIGLDNNTKKEYQYNPDDLISYVETYSWNGANWIKSESNYLSYNDDQKVNIRIYENINEHGIVTKDKYEYFYNDVGDTLEIIISEDFDNPYGEKFHYYFDYDQDNKVITKTYALWTGYEWYGKERYIRYLNENNDPDSVITQIYTQGLWHNTERVVLSYNEDNKVDEIITSEYDYTSISWYLSDKTEYYYNDKGRIDSLSASKYIDDSWGHQSTVYYNYTFDEYGNLAEEYLTKYHTSIDTIKDYQKYIYEYYEPTDVQENISEQSFLSVSPNPATDNFNISINSYVSKNAIIKIYDINGECVHNENMILTENMQLSISALLLPTGVYFIELITDKSVQTERIIIFR
jgi:hypothetical protein